MRYQAHQHMRRWSWLECSGRGFLVINQSAGQLFENEQRRCCYARSGPIVYAHLPISRTPVPQVTLTLTITRTLALTLTLPLTLTL